MSAHTPFLNLSPANPIEGLEEWALKFLRGRGFVMLDRVSAEAAAVDFLRELDYAVFKNGHWETQRALAARLGITVKRIRERRAHPACPPYEVQRGTRGYIIRISSNPAFDAFISAPPKTN